MTLFPVSSWIQPPGRPSLKKHEVHIWGASLELPVTHTEFLKALLADDERDRAARFRRPADSEHFIASRGVLRVILASYLDIHPRELFFSKRASGKPTLVQSHKTDLRFNLSHSGGLALYAISCGADVGIDLELIDADLEVERIADRVFSPSESGFIRSLDRASLVHLGEILPANSIALA